MEASTDVVSGTKLASSDDDDGDSGDGYDDGDDGDDSNDDGDEAPTQPLNVSFIVRMNQLVGAWGGPAEDGGGGASLTFSPARATTTVGEIERRRCR